MFSCKVRGEPHNASVVQHHDTPACERLKAFQHQRRRKSSTQSGRSAGFRDMKSEDVENQTIPLGKGGTSPVNYHPDKIGTSKRQNSKHLFMHAQLGIELVEQFRLPP